MPPTSLARGLGWELRRTVGTSEPVTIKAYARDLPPSVALARCYRELDFLRRLHGLPVPQGIRVVEDPEPGLVLQDLAGHRSLRAVMQAVGPMELARFFEVAGKLCGAVGEMHQRDVIHRALRPENVLVADAGGVLLVGFDQATVMEDETPYELISADPDHLGYVSPEQTGRMNRAVDYRTDLYSLGLIFYEMLAGAPAFEGPDVVSLLHAHVAMRPRPLRELRAELPEALEVIVCKLLEKSPEERYQNAFALGADLERVAAAQASGESIELSSLGASDRGPRFVLSTRLYGREREVKELAERFEQVTRGGRHLLLIGGYSGVGKTALVREGHRLLAAHRGHFAAGKFDQFARLTPWSAMRVALGELLGALATDPATHRQFAAELTKDVRAELAVLCGVIPELSAFGVAAAVEHDLSAADSEDRFRLAFRRLFAWLTSAAHPLVFFLDDLQWVDPVSLRVLEDLAGADELAHLLIVGAYRDNEIDIGHPLRDALRRLADAKAPVSEMTLAPLSVEHVAALVSDTFPADGHFALELARLVHERTAGNPFFVRRLLRMLHQRGALSFDFRSNGWSCDLDAVARLPVAPNVADLVAAELGNLDDETRRLLGVAASMGPTFGLDALASFAEVPPHAVHAALWRAVTARMLSLQQGREWTELGEDAGALVDAHAREVVYRFSHDRIQQAAAALLPAEERPAVHLRLYRVLRGRGVDESRLFDAASHCVQALSLFAEEEDRAEAVDCLLRAASRAVAANAPAAAEHYCRAVLAIEGLGEGSEVRFRACRLLGESLLLLGDFEAAAEALDWALDERPTKLQRVAILLLRNEMWVSQGKLDEALAVLVEILEIFDAPITPSTVADVATRAPETIVQALGGRTMEEVVDGPEATDPEVIALLDALARASDTAYMKGRDWSVAVTALGVKTVLERGVTIAASMAFSSYAVSGGEPATAEGVARRAEYGRIGELLAERYGDPAWVSRANVSNVPHLNRSFRETITRFDFAASQGWASSSLTWAAYAEVRSLFTMLVAGTELAHIDAARLARSARIRRVGRAVSESCCDLLGLFIRSLTEPGSTPWVLGGVLGEAVEVRDRALASGPWAGVKAFALEQALAIIFERWGDAAAACAASAPMRHGLHGMLHEHWFHLFAGIHLVNEPPGERSVEQRARALDEIVAFMEARVPTSPDHEPACHFARALVARAAGEPHASIAELNRAMETARARGQTPLLALAAEEASRVARAQGLDPLASFYVGEAYEAYDAWGARTKADELARRFPTALPSRTKPEVLAAADLESLLKSMQAITAELRRDALLARLMHIVLENAAAQRGLLVIESDGALVVEAAGVVGEGHIQTTLPRETLQPHEAAHALVLEALRTGKVVSVDDLTSEGRFDFSLVSPEGRPRSTLTLPIEAHGERFGALHLESRESSHAFGGRERRGLWLLMQQVVIALENARLYGSLELEIEERTRAEAALRAERDFSVRVFTQLPILACGVRRDGGIEFVNPAVTRLLGVDAEALIGADWWQTMHADPERRAELRSVLERAGSVEAFESRLVDSSGSEHILSWACSGDVSTAPERTHLICFGTDLTETRARERKQQALEAQMLRTQQLETLGTFASGIAHDVNNLLFPISAYAEMLTASLDEGSELHAQASEIATAAQRAGALVRRILAASRTTGQEVTAVRVREVAEEVVRLLRASIDANIQVRTDIDPDCPPIASEPNQIHQALLNLGTNAAYAMRPAGGTLEISAGPDHFPPLSPRAGEPCVTLRVTDSGAGMSEEVQARIFDPFFTTKEVGEGTGLGLWMVHGVVKSAGGLMTVDSEIGRGTTFSLHFPPATDTREVLAARLASRRAKRKARILLVDDDAAVLGVLERALDRFGYEVEPFSSPGEALEAFRASPDAFDLVVTDNLMPRLPGPQLAAELWAIRGDVPVVVLSGTHLSDSELRPAGPYAILGKPLSLPDLDARLGELLRS